MNTIKIEVVKGEVLEIETDQPLKINGKEYKPEPKRPFGMPELGDIFFILCGDGSIGREELENAEYNIDYFYQGNVFPTKEAAELERDARAKEAEYLRFIQEMNEERGFVARFDGEQENMCFSYFDGYRHSIFGSSSRTKRRPLNHHFHPDDLKKVEAKFPPKDLRLIYLRERCE